MLGPNIFSTFSISSQNRDLREDFQRDLSLPSFNATDTNQELHNRTNNSDRNHNGQILISDTSSIKLHNKKFYHKNGILCNNSQCTHNLPKVEPCKPNCRYCNNLDPKISNSYLKYKNMCCLPNESISCKLSNVVYMLKCQCGKAYVGETLRPVHKRWYEHLNQMKKAILAKHNPSIVRTRQKLYDHFLESSCDPENIKFHILDHNINFTTNERENSEDYYIRLMNSAYPFGLNQKVKYFGNIDAKPLKPLNFNNHPYFNFCELRRKRSHGKRKTNNKGKRSNIKIDNSLINEISNNQSIDDYAKILKLTKRNLQTLNLKLSKNSKLHVFTESLLHAKKPKIKTDINEIFIKFHHQHPILNKVPISKICNSMIDTLKNERNSNKNFKIIPSFTYNKKISAFIHNQNQTSRALNKDSILEGLQKMANCCKNFQNKDKKEQHLASGNLELLPDRIKNALQFGNNYRITEKFNLNEYSNILETYKNKNAETLARKTSNTVNKCNEIMNIINQKIIDYLRNLNLSSTNSFSKTELKRIRFISKQLANKFILCPVDKCANNTAIICRNLYIKKLCDDLGIKISANGNDLSIEGNETFQPANLRESEIFDLHMALNLRYTGSNEIEKKLATYYLIPKFHKKGDELKTRPISNGRKTSLNNVIRILTSILLHFRTHFLNIQNLDKKHKSIGLVKSVKSTDEYIEYLEETGQNSNLSSINTYDFKSVFTSFRHDSIIKAITYISGKCFNRKTGTHLKIHKNKCKYNLGNQDNKLNFTKPEIIELLNTVLSNAYIKLGDFIFRQTKGIPMGSASSAILCDLSLIAFEHMYKESFPRPIVNNDQYFEAIRYQDDILVFNFCDFLNISKVIYPDELELEADNTETGKSVNYLDTNLRLTAEGSTISLFDKRDQFNFRINNLFHSSSNVRLRLISNVVYSQLIRFTKICNKFDEFMIALLRIKKQLVNNGHNKEILTKAINRLLQDKFENIHNKFDTCCKRKEIKTKIFEKLDNS